MKKIDPKNVEVIQADGTPLHEKPVSEAGLFSGGSFRVVKMGPIGGLATLVMLPLLIPVFLIGFILLMVLAMIFGKTVFKSGMARVIRRS